MSSVTLLDNLNSFIRSSLHTRVCAWTSPTKSGHETRKLSLAQKEVKYSIVSQHKGHKEANMRLGCYTICMCDSNLHLLLLMMLK